MKMKNILEYERKQLKKYENIGLPNIYKKVGLIIIVLGFLTLIGLRFVEGKPEIIRDLIKKSILIGLLIISISRDKEEDELTVSLRHKSYVIAFIFTVVYAIIQPYITYGIAAFIGKENKESFIELGDFQVLFFMLIIQIMYYKLLKRYR